MNDILSEKAAVWNDRLRYLMKNNPHGKYTQQSLADAMNQKYADRRGSDFTQKTVGRWLKVGTTSGPNGQRVGFPEYETMLYIADFFDVDVGYLTGETDSEQFDIEKAANFFSLTDECVKQIMTITFAGKIPRRTRLGYGVGMRYSFDHLVKSKVFFELMMQLNSLYDCSPVSGVSEVHKFDCLEEAGNYASDVNESLRLTRFSATEVFYRLLDDLFPYAKTEDFINEDAFD